MEKYSRQSGLKNSSDSPTSDSADTNYAHQRGLYNLSDISTHLIIKTNHIPKWSTKPISAGGS